LLGSGRTSLLRAIIGDLPLREGSILVDGKPFAPRSIAHAIDNGIAYVPENRLAEAVFPDLSVSDNVTAAAVGTFSSNGLLDTRAERRAADQLISDFRIRCGSSRHEMSTLSGGNQQKVIIARWLGRKPRILLLDEPSQGVDVLARRDIQEFIKKGAAEGMSVLVVTSDFNELARVADRVVVLRHGAVVAQIQRAQLTEDAITELTYGLVEVPDAKA
jgi:ribose transport system ATP-binding protein